MTRSKLSDADKQTLVRLFQDTSETINSLAQQYGVSASTVRRTIKMQLAAEEYERLLTSKQQPEDRPAEPVAESSPTVTPAATPLPAPSSATPVPKPILKSDQRPPGSPAKAETDSQVIPPSELDTPAAGHPVSPALAAEDDALSQMVDEIEHDLEDEFPDGELTEEGLDDFESEDDLDDEDEFDDEEEDEDEEEEDEEDLAAEVSADTLLEVLPLDTAVLPKQCYLVVDRASELITRPLQDFSNLGKIPESEVQSVTLPIFDNHRIARRFSNRAQRVVKVPNGNLLQKTGAQLTAKGITRLLIRGRVYAL